MGQEKKEGRMNSPYPLPCTETERENELDELMDLIAENAPIEYMREFRKAGVRLGHA